jgi:CRISP-associated protein Cas1
LVKKITNEFSNLLNKPVSYGDKQTAWEFILLVKAKDLAHYLVGKTKELNFVSTEFEVKRVDTQEIRQKILSIPYDDWKKLGLSKGTLHYMK